MTIIGGRIGPKKTSAHSHRITVIELDNKGNETRNALFFYTLRSARNYLREHPRVNAVELTDLKTNASLPVRVQL